MTEIKIEAGMSAKTAIIKLQNQMTTTLTTITQIERKRNMRPSEKAMSLSEYKQRYEALRFAIQAIKTVELVAKEKELTK